MNKHSEEFIKKWLWQNRLTVNDMISHIKLYDDTVLTNESALIWYMSQRTASQWRYIASIC